MHICYQNMTFALVNGDHQLVFIFLVLEIKENKNQNIENLQELVVLTIKSQWS